MPQLKRKYIRRHSRDEPNTLYGQRQYKVALNLERIAIKEDEETPQKWQFSKEEMYKRAFAEKFAKDIAYRSGLIADIKTRIAEDEERIASIQSKLKRQRERRRLHKLYEDKDGNLMFYRPTPPIQHQTAHNRHLMHTLHRQF